MHEEADEFYDAQDEFDDVAWGEADEVQVFTAAQHVNALTLNSTRSGHKADTVPAATTNAAVLPAVDATVPYALHRAAWHGDVAALQRVWQQLPAEERVALDPQGNSVLHVATLRRHTHIVHTLLQLGFPTSCKSARGWTALSEAIAVEDRDIAKAILTHNVEKLLKTVDEKKQLLLDALSSMPDCTFQLKWELGSPLLGLILRKYAPHDTYTVWKRGRQLRVDGTLMGIDDEASTVIPRWKRGNFSLLYDGSCTPSQRWFLHHDKRSYYNLREFDKGGDEDEQEINMETDVDIDSQITYLFDNGAVKTRLKSSEFKFKPVKTWLGYDSTERIEGWNTVVYQAVGKLVSVKQTKAPVNLPCDATWDDYLALQVPEDEIVETPIDPLSSDGLKDAMASDGDGASTSRKASHSRHRRSSHRRRASSPLRRGHRSSPKHADRIGTGTAEQREDDEWVETDDADALLQQELQQYEARLQREADADAHNATTTVADSASTAGSAGKQAKARKLTAKCWMAQDFPLSMEQFLPLLDVIGDANKHVAKIAKFMSKYGQLNMFPVKVQVPIIFTVYIMLTVKKFKHLKAGECDKSFFTVPESYHVKSIEEVMQKKGASRSAFAAYSDEDDSLALTDAPAQSG